MPQQKVVRIRITLTRVSITKLIALLFCISFSDSPPTASAPAAPLSAELVAAAAAAGIDATTAAGMDEATLRFIMTMGGTQTHLLTHIRNKTPPTKVVILRFLTHL